MGEHSSTLSPDILTGNSGRRNGRSLIDSGMVGKIHKTMSKHILVLQQYRNSDPQKVQATWKIASLTVTITFSKMANGCPIERTYHIYIFHAHLISGFQSHGIIYRMLKHGIPGTTSPLSSIVFASGFGPPIESKTTCSWQLIEFVGNWRFRDEKPTDFRLHRMTCECERHSLSRRSPSPRF
jgi:hypothetical protein